MNWRVTDDSRPLLDPEALERVAALELRARRIVEGLIAGRHRSPFHGQSVEFAQHREYAAGDDPRHIDWSVWAKSDRFYIKQFEEETNLRATLLVDASESMAYGAPVSKYDYAAGLTAALAYLLLRQSDAVGLVTFDSEPRTRLPRRSQESHLRAILHALGTRRPGRKTDLGRVLKEVALADRHRGLVVLVSDLFGDAESIERGLGLLRKQRHDVIVFHVLHDDEVDFPFEGSTRFEGLELPDQVLCDPRALRDAYRDALEGFRADWRRRSGGLGIDYRFVRVSEPMGSVLAALLDERLRI